MDTSFIAKQPPPVGCLAFFVGIEIELVTNYYGTWKAKFPKN